MTREEAIEAIKCNWPDSRYTILREALDIASEVVEEDKHFICGATNLPCIRCNPGGCDNRKEGSD